MNWLVFGDDWGCFANTMQHLVKNLPEDDQVIWINSLGMRSPRFCMSDIRRLLHKGSSSFKSIVSGRRKNYLQRATTPNNMSVVDPAVLPFHLYRAVQQINKKALQRLIVSQMRLRGIDKVEVLASNPVSAFYLDGLPTQSISYLRLDDYAKLPGVDPELAAEAEKKMFGTADVVFATAEALLPDRKQCADTAYLPQGVDTDLFSKVTQQPPRSKTLGFIGLLAEWLDYDLILALARNMPDWTFSFVGPIRYLPQDVRAQSNIRVCDPVPYEKLPQVMQTWDAGWIPFRINELTMAVNPLKLREYLAAGLPTFSTPLPEALVLLPTIQIGSSAQDVKNWLYNTVGNDSSDMRQQRRRSIHGDSWRSRANTLRDTVVRTHPSLYCR